MNILKKVLIGWALIIFAGTLVFAFVWSFIFPFAAVIFVGGIFSGDVSDDVKAAVLVGACAVTYLMVIFFYGS